MKYLIIILALVAVLAGCAGKQESIWGEKAKPPRFYVATVKDSRTLYHFGRSENLDAIVSWDCTDTIILRTKKKTAKPVKPKRADFIDAKGQEFWIITRTRGQEFIPVKPEDEPLFIDVLPEDVPADYVVSWSFPDKDNITFKSEPNCLPSTVIIWNCTKAEPDFTGNDGRKLEGRKK